MTDAMTKTMTRNTPRPLFLIKRGDKQWQKDNKKAAVGAA